jgi:quercetin dioxygenase-like cupin family protein
VTATAAATPPTATTDFLRITPAAVEWHEVPGAHGLRTATLVGDPAKPGLYVIRIRFPPHVMSAPHFHPNARYVTVLEGTWFAGTGDVFDATRAVPLPPGSFMYHPAHAAHWDGARGDEPVVVQITGEGPADSISVDPSRDGMIELAH